MNGLPKLCADEEAMPESMEHFKYRGKQEVVHDAAKRLCNRCGTWRLIEKLFEIQCERKVFLEAMKTQKSQSFDAHPYCLVLSLMIRLVCI